MILPQAIMHLLEPLVSASDSLPAILLSVLLCQIFWFAGIHGSLIVTGIMNPFWMANLSANQAALAAGAALPHVYLQGFWDHYLLIGGVGSTLPLAFLLLRSRVAHLRTIGKMGVVPSFFNINEPILFGAPIIMNPMLFIPFVCVPLVKRHSGVCGNPYGLTGAGRLTDAMDNTGTDWRILGCQLGIQSGGDVRDLYGDVRTDVPAVPACLRTFIDEDRRAKSAEQRTDGGNRRQ